MAVSLHEVDQGFREIQGGGPEGEGQLEGDVSSATGEEVDSTEEREVSSSNDGGSTRRGRDPRKEEESFTSAQEDQFSLVKSRSTKRKRRGELKDAEMTSSSATRDIQVLAEKGIKPSRCLNGMEGVKMFFSTSEELHSTRRVMDVNQVAYHTFQLPEERQLKMVI